MTSIPLREIAYARSGDKGCNANIGLIAHSAAGYRQIQQEVSEQRVLEFFSETPVTHVVRYELSNLWALNFILFGVLGKGGSQSLAIDAQGKALGQALLNMSIEISDSDLECCRPQPAAN